MALLRKLKRTDSETSKSWLESLTMKQLIFYLNLTIVGLVFGLGFLIGFLVG